MIVKSIWLAVFLVSTSALAGCDAEPAVRVDAVDVRLVAQQASWHASYLVAKQAGGTIDVPTGREVHVPLGAEVRLVLASRDYISNFTLPQLGLRDFAAPGLPSEIHFRADREGRYDVRADEFCGLPHTDKTRGWLVVEDPAAFRTWIQRHTRESRR